MTIDVFGLRVPVKIKDIGVEDDGDYCPLTKIIRVSNRLSGKDLDSTILHELLHAFLDRLGFSIVLKEDVEELLVRNLESFLMEKYDMKLKK